MSRLIGVPEPVTVRAPAKVNLHLSVGGVRRDGYHNLATVFHAISLFDEVTATPANDLTLAVGYQGQPPVDRLAGLAGELAGTGALVSLLAQVRPGRADLTFAPRWEGLPVPAGLAVGAGGRGTGPDRDWPGPALAVPLAGTRLVGSGARAAVWFPLGDGASPVGWQALKLVAEHLRPETRPSGWT